MVFDTRLPWEVRVVSAREGYELLVNVVVLCFSAQILFTLVVFPVIITVFSNRRFR